MIELISTKKSKFCRKGPAKKAFHHNSETFTSIVNLEFRPKAIKSQN